MEPIIKQDALVIEFTYFPVTQTQQFIKNAIVKPFETVVISGGSPAPIHSEKQIFILGKRPNIITDVTVVLPILGATYIL